MSEREMESQACSATPGRAVACGAVVARWGTGCLTGRELSGEGVSVFESCVWRVGGRRPGGAEKCIKMRPGVGGGRF